MHELTNLIICSIGGKEIGFGHISRMIPIYDAFEQIGIQSKFYIQGDDKVLDILESRNVKINNWILGDLVQIFENDIILIDTLDPPVELINKYLKITKNVYFISDQVDTNELPFQVINWRIGAADLGYSNGIYGEKFVPLRREVLVAENEIKHTNSLKRIVISMGAGDVLNLIPKTVAILKNSVVNAHILVVIRSFHPDYSRLLEMQCNEIEILVDALPFELFNAISKCDFAIASGGHSIYEFAFLGIPVIHIRVAENQEPAKCWDNTGFTYPIGMYEESSYKQKIIEGCEYFREEQLLVASKKGKELIDGLGAQRLCHQLLNKAL